MSSGWVFRDRTGRFSLRVGTHRLLALPCTTGRGVGHSCLWGQTTRAALLLLRSFDRWRKINTSDLCPENLHQDWQAPASRWPLAPRTTQAARRQQAAQAGAGAASKKSTLVKAKMCHIIM